MSTRSLRNLRSRDGKKEDDIESSDFDDEHKDFTTASHYLSPRIGGKRKGENVITIHNTPKKRRKVTGELQDVYCWECHKECIDEGALDCATCPRTYHPKCIAGKSEAESPVEESDFVCPVCHVITKAECAESRSWAMQLLTPEQLCPLLGFALRRMRHSDSEAFQNPVPASLVPEYYDLIFHPMDLSTLEKNVNKCIYASTEAFMEDAKWILHNCIIFHGPSSKYCQDAKLIQKICRHEMAEIELCPDCYKHSCIRQDNWFAEPCTNPHCLVFAKLKGFPYWPAKALRMSSGNANVDVRFFGAHDRAWIPTNQVFLLSEHSPALGKNVRKHGLDAAVKELHSHVEAIKRTIGEFHYAPQKNEFKPEHLFNCPLFGGSSDDDFNGRPVRSARLSAAVSPTPSGSSISCKSDITAAVDIHHHNSSWNTTESTGKDAPLEEGANESICSKMSSKGSKTSTPEKKEKTDANGVFTLEEEMGEGEKEEGVAGAPEGIARKTVSKFKESLPLLERLQHSLDSDRQEDEEGSVSPASLSLSREETPPTQPKVNAKKRNLSFLVEKMQQRTSSTPEAVQSSSGVGEEPPPSTSPPNAPPSLSFSKQTPPAGGVDKQQSAASVPAGAKKSSVTITYEKMNQARVRPGTHAVKSPSRSSSSALPPPSSQISQYPLPSTTHTANRPPKCSESTADALRGHAEKISLFLTTALEQMWADALHRGTEPSLAAADETPAPAPPAPPPPVVPAPAPVPVATSSATEKELRTVKGDLTKLQWMHKSALASLKQDTRVSVSEMRATAEADKMRALEELRRRMTEEKAKAIADTKTKQWCASCGKEAVFYCCWNTSYCDYPCQQRHWPKHQHSCAQIRQNPPVSNHHHNSHAPNTNPPDQLSNKNLSQNQGLMYHQYSGQQQRQQQQMVPVQIAGASPHAHPSGGGGSVGGGVLPHGFVSVNRGTPITLSAVPGQTGLILQSRQGPPSQYNNNAPNILKRH